MGGSINPIDEGRLRQLLSFQFSEPLDPHCAGLLDEMHTLSEHATELLVESIHQGKDRPSSEYNGIMKRVEGLRKREQYLSAILVDRNLIGRGLEAAGRLDEAIALYEANVRDLFRGSHPYWQLAVIYRRRKQYDEEVRVLAQFLEIGLAAPDSRKRQRFQDRLDTARRMREKAMAKVG